MSEMKSKPGVGAMRAAEALAEWMSHWDIHLTLKPHALNTFAEIIERETGLADVVSALEHIVLRGPSEDCGDHCHAGCMYCQGSAALAKARGEKSES